VFLIGFPLLIIPFAIYNMFAFLLGIAWSQELTTFHMMSGADWTLTWGELLVAVAGLMLFFEMFKARRLSARSIVDHGLSTLLFIGMSAEFLLVRQAASGTFFLLLVISFIDVAGGFTMTIHSVQHDIAIDATDSVPAAAADSAPAAVADSVPAAAADSVPAAATDSAPIVAAHSVPAAASP
jgi:hypothetical protein